MKRSLIALATVVAVLSALIPPVALARSPQDRFERIDLGRVRPDFKPAMLGGGREVTVIVKLTGAPVAARVADARKQGRDLSRQQRNALRAELKAAQDRLAGRVKALGGRITARYQDAYNGFAVRLRQGRIPALRALPGVSAVHQARIFEPDHVNSVPYIGAPAAWQDYGYTGAGVKIAIIDTGIDYYHANLGGSGDPAQFEADSGLAREPGTFPTAKVIEGYDFVGDAYDASSDAPAHAVPHPDPDPLDCNGHGSHVAGSAAGNGVTAAGAAYTGPYDSTTYSTSFRIGPGVAPQASLLGYRIFGCDGSASEEVIVAALNRAFSDGADVVNMSLGSPFGRTDEPSAEASNTLALAGVVVVASAGNSGSSAYITGAPAVAQRAISVAAFDTIPTFRVATVSGASLAAKTVINANEAPLASPVTGNLRVLTTSTGAVSLGCSASDYASVVPGEIVVAKRGTCARVDRAILGQAAGAAAVIMINTSDAFPPLEGPISGVTIPFLGAKSSDEAALKAAHGSSVTAADAGTVANPTYKRPASFTSGGPANVDSAFKPDVTAPGVSIKSTAVGSGSNGERLSGTSMASPHTAGVAALVTQAHPLWSTEDIKAAIMNTASADAAVIANYNVRLAGSGVVQPRRAVDTVATATTGPGVSALSFGYDAASGAYSETHAITIENHSGSSLTYDLAAAFNGNALGADVSFSPSSVTVAAGGTATVDVTLALTAAEVAALPAASQAPGALVTIRGAVTATPTSSGTGIYALRIPFILAPRGTSNVSAGAKAPYSQAMGIARSSVTLTNGGIHAGNADVYAWGLSDANDQPAPADGMDVRSIGVQSLPGSLGGAPDSDRLLIFAVNVWERWSNAAVSEFDIAIDSNNNGKVDYFVVGVDLGAVLAGSFDGRMGSFVFDARGELVDAFFADAPMNGSTLLLPLLASDLGLKKGDSDFNYSAASFGIVPGDLVDVVSGSARFDSHKPAVSQGDWVPLAPGASATLPLWVDRGKFASAPAKGWLIVTMDDANGAAQAQEVPVGTLPPF